MTIGRTLGVSARVSNCRYRWGSEEESIAIHLLYRHWWRSQSLNDYSLLRDWVAQAELKWYLWTPKWQSSFGELLFCLAEIVGLQERSACISRSWRVYNISLDHKMNRTTVNRILEIIKRQKSVSQISIYVLIFLSRNSSLLVCFVHWSCTESTWKDQTI